MWVHKIIVFHVSSLRLLLQCCNFIVFYLSFSILTFYSRSTLIHSNSYLNHYFFNLPDLSHSFIRLFTIWIRQSVISIHFMKSLTYLYIRVVQFFLYVGSYLLTLTYFVFVLLIFSSFSCTGLSQQEQKNFKLSSLSFRIRISVALIFFI